MSDLIDYKQTLSNLSTQRVPYLVMNLIDPLVDAGDISQAIDATIADLDAVNIATFNSDLLYDYRAQRPIVSYLDGKLNELAYPQMRLNLVTDIAGKNFLYLCGQEPDFRWQTLTQDILDIVKKYGVEQVITYASMPATVPHTRPADMLIRTTKPAQDAKYVQGRAEHFSALADFFEYFAGKSDISVTNLRVRVPFYLARGLHPFVQGALAAVKMTATLGGPKLPLGDLEQLEDQQKEEIASIQVEGAEFEELLQKLELEYDATSGEAGFVKTDEALPEIPSSEEIGKAAEEFLATQSAHLRRAAGAGRDRGPSKSKSGSSSEQGVDQTGKSWWAWRRWGRNNSQGNTQSEGSPDDRG
ncbi:PAC2 family protein [Arcanobacterium bovis]|uniref:PAC2 family protein n=1 Tax=Arcanobacterium bovis TaxID=2529275 RepID=A0A4Q9V0Z3_9ACTO|nr:PAC2 family protein [Arcanobacterium bovis]TBW22754.1 PAC2 family protein [Arcanobacterium bovis]